jgi:hypothetical protein
MGKLIDEHFMGILCCNRTDYNNKSYLKFIPKILISYFAIDRHFDLKNMSLRDLENHTSTIEFLIFKKNQEDNFKS